MFITRAGIRVRVALEIEREHQVRMKARGRVRKTGEKGALGGVKIMENVMEKVFLD